MSKNLEKCRQQIDAIDDQLLELFNTRAQLAHTIGSLKGDGPIYRPPVANDYNWCVGSKSNIPYHCTVSRIVGVAEKAAG